MIRVRGLNPIPTDSLGRKWISWVDTPQTTLEEMNVYGKFVFVGVTAAGVMPTLATPNGLLEIRLNRRASTGTDDTTTSVRSNSKKVSITPVITM